MPLTTQGHVRHTYDILTVHVSASWLIFPHSQNGNDGAGRSQLLRVTFEPVQINRLLFARVQRSHAILCAGGEPGNEASAGPVPTDYIIRTH